MISEGFFHFSKFWFSGLLGGLKRKKWSKMTKKFCLLHSISQEPYIWFSFMVHICKLIISPGAFFIFSTFLFSRLLEGKRAKNSPKWQKILSFVLSISEEPYIIWLFVVHKCKMMISPGIFSFFQNFDFPGF